MIRVFMINLTCLANIEAQKQKLLFDVSPTVGAFPSSHYRVADRYYRDGYIILDAIRDEQEVIAVLYKFVKALSAKALGVPTDFLNKMQLATTDYIPNCHEIISTGFQALHFDMGQPFLAKGIQPMYVINALYRPLSATPNIHGKTRIVNIHKLGKQKKFGSRTMVQERLLKYVRLYGDGWRHPLPVNTYRLACFARFIDAVSGLNSLTDKIDTQIGQCFEYDSDEWGTTGLQHEYDFFRKVGLDLAAVEEQVIIEPGQLLIIDNIRCVHGRVGPRQSRELLNVLFAVQAASKENIEAFSSFLVSEFSL